jgi:hypothetical protein
MSADNLQFYIGYSLVDITATGIIRGANIDSLERNQQRNWETVLQCIGLRTQPQCIQEPKWGIAKDLSIMKFGDFYQGKDQMFWSWVWATESKEIYDLPNNPMGGLLQDFEQVPVVTGLTETAKFMLPIFYPYGSIKNIYIERYID